MPAWLHKVHTDLEFESRKYGYRQARNPIERSFKHDAISRTCASSGLPGDAPARRSRRPVAPRLAARVESAGVREGHGESRVDADHARERGVREPLDRASGGGGVGAA